MATKYKGWPRITEQTIIVDRQRPLSTSGKSTHISGFISFPTSAARIEFYGESYPLQRDALYEHQVDGQEDLLGFSKKILEI